MRVLGIDPGIAIVGYSILDYDNNKIKCLEYGCITTSSKSALPDRLSFIYQEMNKIVVGYGRADKRQVQETVKTILKFNEIPKPDDAADAVAVALCHIFGSKFKYLNEMK